MDDFSTPGEPNAFGLWPSPCTYAPTPCFTRRLFILTLTSPGAVNYPEPGKRPLSSTSPTILEHEDGSVYLTLGGSGGSRIFPAVLQVILGVDRWGLDISQAIEFGRVHDQLYPTYVDVDSNYPEEGIRALKERGHNVTGESEIYVSSNAVCSDK
jgi:gamma-glutamyltranspeptidase/glutathione hydrolase/leukotriene-C4 hydrolase